MGRRRRPTRPINGDPCKTCGRVLSKALLATAATQKLLSAPDYCAPCGMPMTERARRRAPIEGYARFAAAMERHPTIWPSMEIAL